MQKRIDLLKSEIERLRVLAQSCDPDIATKFLALAKEMHHLVQELEDHLPQTIGREK